MAILESNSIRGNSSSFNSPVQFLTSGGVENGTLCKAWVNFNGTGTVAIRDDFNVNTITDQGNGTYTINFSTALADSDYSWALNGRYDSSNAASQTFITVTANCGGFSSSAFRLGCIVPVNNTFQDLQFVTASFFR